MHGRMVLLIVPSSVRKILLLVSVYTCYFVVVAVVFGAVGVGACIDIASGLVLGVPVVGSWPVLPVAVTVCVAYTLDLKMWWAFDWISGPALFVGVPHFLAPAARWPGACCS
jgi:hypothetical protein